MHVLPADSNGLNAAVKILLDGGIVAHATETCYGFACDLRNPDAVMRLFKIKQRPSDQPVSALFSSLDQAKEYVEWNEEAQRLAEEYLPGPLTIILPMRKGSDLMPTSSTILSSSLGIRLSSHPFAQQLVMEFGSPISTTSANLHDRTNPYSSNEIRSQFRDREFQPDLILDSGALHPNPPSTVIDLTTASPLKRRSGTVWTP